MGATHTFHSFLPPPYNHLLHLRKPSCATSPNRHLSPSSLPHESLSRQNPRAAANASLFFRLKTYSTCDPCDALTGGMCSTVHVFVVSPDTRTEGRFDLHTSIGQLKVSPYRAVRSANLRCMLSEQARTVHWDPNAELANSSVEQ